ncbi:MAG: aldehyde ferredoxin oxidoreductase N-terminal domain-containing protein, partial [Pseudomonadota bacterium]
MQIIKTIKYEPRSAKGGYTDQILDIDLSALEMSILTVPPEFKTRYVGGRGYALKLIWDRTRKETRYDSPENVLVMASGPLCGDARFPGSGKFIVG